MAQSQSALETTQTTVEVRATGHVRDALGTPRLSFTFEGDTLREFAEAFFEEYDVRDLVIAETEAESATRGWAPIDAEDVPGELRKNPDGEQTRAYARILVNGQFNENLAGFDTKLNEGDRVALVYPFLFCL
ncbi:MoaD/ThiS family protein [Halobellus limi]|jgi:molybdopterin converting factor small subunit|uniref:Pterin cluster protein n=1 Tax=Halobellus limi TaxID=699433 RepID=A0A1H5UC73_9EURY|nr:MoaD/ThiS family protein [Halobellus limi]QCC47093.1 pterin cluster protein [Halobellus limi]SEF72018.1 ThiS family protein [Halobellus limi]